MSTENQSARAGDGKTLTDEQLHELALKEGDYDSRSCCWSFNGDSDCRYNLFNFARAVIAADRAQFAAAPVVLAGHKLVPIEPTDDMLSNVDEEVGGHCHSCSKWRASWDDCRRVWAAMLAAAPAAAPAAVPMCSEQAVLHALTMARSETHQQGDAALWQAFGRAMWRQFNAMLGAPAWQPIETAPLNVLVWVSATKRMSGPCIAMHHSRDGWVVETPSEWVSIYAPTHWMPYTPPAGPGVQAPATADGSQS